MEGSGTIESTGSGAIADLEVTWAARSEEQQVRAYEPRGADRGGTRVLLLHGAVARPRAGRQCAPRSSTSPAARRQLRIAALRGPYTVSVGRTTGSPARSAATASIDLRRHGRGPRDPAWRQPRDNRAPRADQTRAERVPSATSNTSALPGRRTSRAPRPICSVTPCPTRALGGSQSRTSGWSLSSSSGSTYGGLETTRSYGPPGDPRLRSWSTSCTRSASPSAPRSPWRARARPRKHRLPSPPPPARSSAIASAIAPVPVPTSSTAGCAPPSSSARQRSTTTSVSGRGISPRQSTFNVSRRKPHSPRTYASGSRVPRRRTARANGLLLRRQRAVVLEVIEPRQAQGVGERAARRLRAGLGTPSRVRNSSTPDDARATVIRERALQRRAALLGGQRVRELVEVALEDRVEPMLRELDAVVGEAVLGEVVGADLLGSLAARRSARGASRPAPACCRSRSCSYRRARSTRIALSRFLSCERSSCIATTMPVGMCVMRTAESVVLTLWPPGPVER